MAREAHGRSKFASHCKAITVLYCGSRVEQPASVAPRAVLTGDAGPCRGPPLQRSNRDIIPLYLQNVHPSGYLTSYKAPRQFGQRNIHPCVLAQNSAAAPVRFSRGRRPARNHTGSGLDARGLGGSGKPRPAPKLYGPRDSPRLQQFTNVAQFSVMSDRQNASRCALGGA
jgi:hypothetical protein